MMSLILGKFAIWLAKEGARGRLTASNIWDEVRKFLNATWALILIISGWLFYCVARGAELVDAAYGALSEAVMPNVTTSVPSQVAGYLAAANTIFPLTEGMTFLTAYLGLVLILTTYRLIKSWIPTLS